MKIKVLKRFHDKVTGEVHEVGEVVEVTDQRGEEITSSPLGVAEIMEDEGLSSLSKAELVAKAEELGLETRGLKKDELIAAIEAAIKAE